MTIRHVGLAAAVLLSATAPAYAAPSALGVWRAQTHHGVVELFGCGGALCGRVVTSDVLKDNPDMKDVRNKDTALRTRPLKGLTILRGFSGGPREWKNGEVYDPEDGNTYHGTIKLVDPKTVKLTGCVVFPLCQTQTWTRAQ